MLISFLPVPPVDLAELRSSFYIPKQGNEAGTEILPLDFLEGTFSTTPEGFFSPQTAPPL